MGDGGHDQDSKEQCGEGHENFGSIRGRDHTVLSNRHTFFEYNQTYVLDAWHMLEKHDFLRSSFQVLNSKQSSGDGGADVPPCIFDPDDDTYTSRSNQSCASSSSSKKTTARNKSDDATKGLNKLGDSF